MIIITKMVTIMIPSNTTTEASSTSHDTTKYQIHILPGWCDSSWRSTHSTVLVYIFAFVFIFFFVFAFVFSIAFISAFALTFKFKFTGH